MLLLAAVCQVSTELSMCVHFFPPKDAATQYGIQHFNVLAVVQQCLAKKHEAGGCDEPV